MPLAALLRHPEANSVTKWLPPSVHREIRDVLQFQPLSVGEEEEWTRFCRFANTCALLRAIVVFLRIVGQHEAGLATTDQFQIHIR